MSLTWCPACHLVKINVLANGFATGVHLEDLDAALHIWPLDCHLPVEATWPQQCLIQDLQTQFIVSGEPSKLLPGSKLTI